MNKQTYITPEMEITQLETVAMLAVSSTKAFNMSNETTDDDAWMSTGRRDSWGNLWGGKE